jgi:hypothetical protein
VRRLDGESYELVADAFALACVQTRADLQAERLYLVADRARAADRSSGTIEGSEEAVARVIDLSPVPAVELVADRRIVGSEEFAPAHVS